jgi:hypothetical protein
MRATALPPVSRANRRFIVFPGACAPGFMLTPASQAKKIYVVTFAESRIA